MNTYQRLKAVPLIAVLILSGCGADDDTGPSGEKSALTAEEARGIAKEAFIYGFPMVVNYKTMYLYVIDKASPEYKGEFNEVDCQKTGPL